MGCGLRLLELISDILELEVLTSMVNGIVANSGHLTLA